MTLTEDMTDKESPSVYPLRTWEITCHVRSGSPVETYVVNCSSDRPATLAAIEMFRAEHMLDNDVPVLVKVRTW